MTKVEQTTLFELLSDTVYREELIKSIEAKLSSKEFWEEDEKRYLELREKLYREHRSIEMSYEKLHKPFTI